MKKDTVVIIPAFNEEKSIGLVINDIPKERVMQIIVVDNNSTDRTAKISAKLGANIALEKQRGYGKACLKGIEEAKKLNPTNIVFLDGDYSDFPKEMKLLLDKLDDGYEFVLGSRMINQSARLALLPQARFGNQLATVLTKILFDGVFTDLGPFRAIKLSSLDSLEMKDENFGWTIEMQVKAVLLNLKYTEVSVNYRKRVGVSKITGTLSGTILAGYKIIYTIFYYRIKTLLSL